MKFILELYLLSISNLIFAKQAVKIKLEIDKKSSQKIRQKNQFLEIEILKNQVQIDRGTIKSNQVK